MITAEQLFGAEDCRHLEATIRAAESGTSGEIRVHIDDLCDEDVLDRAAFLFSELDMHKTALRNGVLIYISIVDHKMAILGDAGINAVTGPTFWEETRKGMTHFFKEEKWLEGLAFGIQSAGEKLKLFFPYASNDSNELPNTITMGSKTARR
jgi:uncharacterized membrane protein